MRYLWIAALAPILLGAFCLSSDREEPLALCYWPDGRWGAC
jgi:hypothetical protein